MYSSVSVGLEAGGITRTRRDGDSVLYVQVLLCCTTFVVIKLQPPFMRFHADIKVEV